MKISLFTIIFKDRSLKETLEIAHDIGFEGIEVWGQDSHISSNSSLDYVKEIKKIADDNNLKIIGIGSYIDGFSIKSDADCMKEIDEIKRYLPILDILDCDFIRVNPGGPNAFKAQNYHYEKSAYWLRKASDIIKESNKKIVMEMHNGSIIETPESALRLIKMIDRNNVGVIHDAGNMYITDTDYGKKSVELLGRHIFHVHVKDEIRVKDSRIPGGFQDSTMHGLEFFQHKLLGEGAVDHKPLLNALNEIGYDGYLSLECHAAFSDLERAKHDYEKLKELLKEC